MSYKSRATDTHFGGEPVSVPVTVQEFAAVVLEFVTQQMKEAERIGSKEAFLSLQVVSMQVAHMAERVGGTLNFQLNAVPEQAKIPAIKIVRAHTGVGLKVAKEFVETAHPLLSVLFPLDADPKKIRGLAHDLTEAGCVVVPT